MKAFAITGLKETGFVDRDEPVVGAGEVLLEVKYVGYCGSDLNTSSPRRIRQNAGYAAALVPERFWKEIL